MKTSRNLLFSLLLLCVATLMDAKPFLTVKRFSGDEEALQGKITHLIQDKKGFIWISSFNGLNKYDGYKFIKYKSRPGENSVLNTNRINAISENSDGDIWCQTSDRMYLFQTQEEQFIDIQQIFEKKRTIPVKVRSIYNLSNGVTWFVSEAGECFRLLNKDPLNSCVEFKCDTKKESEIIRIWLDSRGYEWIFCKNGAYRYDKPQQMSKVKFSFAQNYKDKLWLTSYVRSQMALYSYEDDSFSFIDFPEPIERVYNQKRLNDSILITATSSGIVRTNMQTQLSEVFCRLPLQLFQYDRVGTLWGIGDDYEVYRVFPDGNYELVKCPADHHHQSYQPLFKEDEYGTLWLLFNGTSDILYYDSVSGTFVRPENPYVAPHEVKGFYEDSQGNIWFRQERWIDRVTMHNTPFEVHPSYSNDEVRSIMVDKDKRYWFGLRTGIVEIYNADGNYAGNLAQTGRIVADKLLSFGTSIYCFKEDSQGNIWMGSKTDGLYLLQPTGSPMQYTVSHYENNPEDLTSLSNSSVYSVEEDSYGHIWVGTFGGGINLFNKGQFIHAQNQLGYNSIMPKTVRFVKEVRKGVLMIGSKEGLFVMNTDFKKTEEVQMYCNEKRPYDVHSLSDNDVMMIFCTVNKQIYLTTCSGGICRVLSDSLLTEKIQFESITKEDGLASDVSYSMVEDTERNLWIVSERALSRFSEDNRLISVYDDAYFPKTQIFSEVAPLMVGNHVLFGTIHGLVSIEPSMLVHKNYCPPLVFTDLIIKNVLSFKRLGNEKKLSLKAGERILTLKFAALDYQDKSRLKYAYKMDGVDKDWNETSDNGVTYINLPPGDLRFHLKSTNSDGFWVDNERVMAIHVNPTFFETGWGIAFLVLMGISIIVACIMVYLRFYRLRHRLSVEQQMTDIKLRFFTDISHELRTPLTLVDGPISEVLEDKTLSTQSRYYLEIVQRNTRRMLNLVNQILDLRKIQNKKMTLLVEQIEVKGQMQRIMENFSELANQHHIDFTLNCADGIDALWLDRDKFEKIFFNLLSNAFKFTPDGKRITVSITQMGQTIEVAVTDEGIGIKKENIPNLFQRFETVMKSNLFKPSSGIGLSLVKQFVEMHHAQISVVSQLEKGSTFTVAFPTGKKHFEKEANVEFLVNDMLSAEKVEEEPLAEMDEEVSDDSQSTVLIVEDNDELRDFMHKILGSHYKVVEAKDGEEGLRMGKQLWPDLIITDIMMPRMDGFEMVEHIKADPDIYQIPIIVLTAKTAIDDRIKGVEMGVDDYVIKPFSASYLKARTAALIEQRKQLKNRLLELLSQENSSLARRSIEPNMPQITPADELFIQEVMAFMENNMDNSDLAIDDFADAVKMGRTVFYNKLKAILGLTPIDFVQEMRIKRAVQLMQSKNFSIAEIAYKTGFNDPKYFSRCFKKHFGESPSEYIKKL